MNLRVVQALGLCGLCVAVRSDTVGSATTRYDAASAGAARADAVRRDALAAQQRPESPVARDTARDPSQDFVYICPMDPDVRAHAAGTCRRCGMTLVAGVPDPVEFHLDMRVIPPAPTPAALAVLQFLVRDPWKDRPVPHFNVIHERRFHAFVVSEDLDFFEHGHPMLVADGVFQYPTRFPKAGMYRVLGDFYPEGGTPQLTSQTVIVPGEPPAPRRLVRDYSPKSSTTLGASLITIPEAPVAGGRTQMRFIVSSGRPLERYLGAWGHMLAVSNDLIDMMHEHPFIADGGPQLEFEVVFPRPAVYRVWVQLQSAGVVNTVHFDVPVKSLE